MGMGICSVSMALKGVPNFSVAEKSWISGTEYAQIFEQGIGNMTSLILILFRFLKLSESLKFLGFLSMAEKSQLKMHQRSDRWIFAYFTELLTGILGSVGGVTDFAVEALV